MKTLFPRILGGWIFLFAFHAFADVHYVSLDSTNPEPPFLTWATAATNIQDAIDASTNGDTVLVTNGIYASGGRVMAGGGSATNRVVLDRAITVQSVNGPWVTIIQGSGSNNTPSAVRCAWMTNNATLIGFTLEFGCTPVGNYAGGVLCTSTSAVIGNCVIVSNNAFEGSYTVASGTLNNCLISGNGGDGAAELGGNILKNCTIVNNSTYGISDACVMTNCIVYYNTENGTAELADYCCITPLPGGMGNFSSAPQLFADGVHLLMGSPCIGAGTNVATGTDIFGQPWATPPSVGCAEYNPAPITTPPAIILGGNFPGFAVHAAAAGAAPLSVFWLKDGAPLQDNGHFTSTQTTNLMVTTVLLSDVGSYQLVASNAFGVTTTAVVTLGIHCVDAAATNPTPPYLSWATAATNIQNAINASENGDIVLVTNGVYNFGEETLEGGFTNRVSIDRGIRVQSVNGPWVTTIQGAGATNGASAVRCAWLTNNAVLAGFTLEGGATATTGPQGTSQAGGAIWCLSSSAVVDNCVIRSNTASESGIVYQGTLNNCLTDQSLA